MDWDKLRVFHAVAEAGSFTHAGESLNLSQSAVSRQISGLEESLRVPLFHRHARGLILTEQGEMLHKAAREIFAKLAMTEVMLTETKDKARGPLKITTTVAFGSVWLAPRLVAFRERAPDIALSLILDDRELDLAMREADVAIRMTPPRQPDLIQRQLASLPVALYAAPAYLERHGTPTTIEQVAADHQLISYPAGADRPFPHVGWLLEETGVETHRNPRVIVVNSMTAQVRLCEAGGGIAALPTFLATGPGLVRIPIDRNGPEIAAYFVYAEELRHSKRVAVFRDYLLGALAESQLLPQTQAAA